MSENPFVADIRSQANGLRKVLAAGTPDQLGNLDVGRFDRVIFSGMGASHFAAYPAWLALVQAGVPAWWIETGELLHDGLGLITARTLLILTSQSGGSAEIVALLEALASRRPACVLAVTNNLDADLAKGADVVVPILAEKEYTVSTRSYINSVVMDNMVAGVLSGMPLDLDPYWRAADALDPYLGDAWAGHVEAVRATLGVPERFFVLGRGVALGTAMQGALVIKEAAKLAVEAMSTAQFRHGPFELADSRLTVIMLEGDNQTSHLNRRFADSLKTLEARVIWLGNNPPEGVTTLPLPGDDSVAPDVTAILPLNIAAVVLAEAGGFVPGEFRHSGKVTKSL